VPYYQGGWSKVLGKEALKSDQIHPNAAGYAAFTENFAAWLREEGWLR
jgi:GDSL lipase/acylhydrolase domain protein